MSTFPKHCDVAVVGGGIVGLATGYHLAHSRPGKTVVVLEKEAHLAMHQTGHNSGVLHSGIYYKPGSLKALNCRAGKKAMEEFCQREGIAHEICGKVIVATDESEFERLGNLLQRGAANGVACRLIGREELHELEPHCSGLKAIHVPEAGIVNYRQVCERLAQRVREKQGEVLTSAGVTAIQERDSGVVLQTTRGELEARYVVNCGGLHSDRITALAGTKPSAKIIPFRGEYYDVNEEAEKFCRNLIYPVPDPQFPFLGVHFTRMVMGGVECGPNAVLAFAREGYRKTDLNLSDLLETLGYSGFRRLAAKHWRMALGEFWRSFSKAAFVKALQRLVPEIRAEHLRPGHAGIRAQAVLPDGGLVDDFVFDERKRIINVVNAPSPGATASLAIGQAIVEKLATHF